MAFNLDIDPELIEKAIRLGDKKTRKAVVIEALKEYIRRHEQMKIVDLFGEIEFVPGYDYKKQRKKQ